MDGEELGGTFVIAVEELGLNGLWSTIKDLVESRMPLQGITLPNKVGKPVAVPKLPLMFVLSTDKRLLRLKQYSHSPVTWFRNPHTHLVLVSSADVHEYKSTLRAQLKRVTADIERDWGGPGVGSEWLILYVRPFELEPADKGARRVYEKLCDDWSSSSRRRRVVRLDIPLQAFTGPAAAASQRTGQAGRTGFGVQTGGQQQGLGVWGAGATGLDELSAGLRDSIRAAFEARQASYDAEVRRLLNERRDPKWSFTTLYLVKDSFALMLEGAGLWEDAFQEYVELETVYLDTLEAAAAAAAAATTTPAEAAAAAVREAADFGLTGSDAEDVASLLSSSWRAMRRLVLWKKSVQEFHFRQYLFAAQARVLLRLGRPVDVAERGLVFVQNFLAILAAREAAGLIKPWFKECWAFSACMSLITAVTGYSAQHINCPPDWDWDASDLASSSTRGPSGPAARAAMRQLGAALAAEKAAAAAAATAGGSVGLELRAAASGSSRSSNSSSRSTEGDRGRMTRTVITSPINPSPAAGGASPSAASAASTTTPILSGSEWELDASSTAIRVVGGGGGSSSTDRAAPSGSSTPAAAAADSVEVVDEYESDLPPLDLAVLRGQAVTPGNAGLLLQAGEQRRELMDRLYCCLLGHLYHLARGELLRLGSALRLPEAAATAAGSASILQLGKAAFAPPAGTSTSSSSAATVKGGTGSTGSTGVGMGGAGSIAVRKRADKERDKPGSGSNTAAGSTDSGSSLSAGVELLREAAASGGLGPRMVAQLQELLLTPLCGFSQMINKYADGSGVGLTYEVHTPKLGLDEDPLAAALTRADSQSTPYLNTLSSIPNSSSSPGSAANSPTAAGAAGTAGVFDRMRRAGNSGSSSAAGGGAATAGQQQQSRLSKVSGDSDADAAAEHDAGVTNSVSDGGAGGGLARQDSFSSLATINIRTSEGGGAMGAGAAGVDGGEADCSSQAAAGAAAAGNGGSIADSASSVAGHGVQAGASFSAAQTDALSVSPSSASLSAASGLGLKDTTLGLGPGPPKVATHVRSASALPAAGGAGTAGAAGGGLGLRHGGASAPGGAVSPRRLEGLVDPGAIAAVQATSSTNSSHAGGVASLQPAAAAVSAAAGVPAWVGEWRLQLALRNPAGFEELLLALSRRAAWCYAKAGRLRSSALIYADVAVLALQRGQLEQAARLLDRMRQIFACEGWQLLLGQLLPKLLAVQCLAAQPLLPFTALSLLALPPGAAAAADRQAAFEELLSAVGAVPASALGLGLGFGGLSAGFSLNPGADLALQQDVLQLAALSAVQLRPAPGTYSHFLGSEAWERVPDAHAAAAGHQQQQVLMPVLSPPARRPCAGFSGNSTGSGGNTAGAAAAAAALEDARQSSMRGAALLVVGDSLSLAVDVVSRLPGPVLLRRLVLSLVQLHKATWLSSSGGPSIFGGTSAGGLLAGGSLGLSQQQQQQQPLSPLQLQQVAGFDKQQQLLLQLGAGSNAAGKGGVGFSGAAAGFTAVPLGNESPGPPAAAAAAAAAGAAAGVVRWQEGEELMATRLLAAFTPGTHGGPSSGSSSSSSGFVDPVGAATAAAAAAAGSSSSSSGCCCQLLPDGSLLLVPGLNRLVFQLAPVREGLYCLKQLKALLGTHGELLIGMPPAASLSLLAAAEGIQRQQQQHLAGVPPADLAAVLQPDSVAAGEAIQIGGVTSNGTVVSEVVVARVVAPAPRVQLSPVLPDGCLPAGCTAWLGVLLRPLHDAVLRRPRMHIQPSQLLSLATAVAPGVLVGQGLAVQGVGVLSGSLSGDSSGLSEQQQQQQQLLPLLGRSISGIPGASAGSVVQQQQQVGQWVYVTPLEEQQQQQEAAAVPPGRWLPVSRGCVDLSAFVGPGDGSSAAAAAGLCGPLLVWMQVLVGNPPAPLATVKVAAQPPPLPAAAAAATPAGLPLSRLSSAAVGTPLAAAAAAGGSSTSLAAAAAVGRTASLAVPGAGLPPGGSAAAAAKVVPEPCLLLASRPIDVAAELALQLEYTAGVWRSHCCCLQLPLQQPASVSAAALQLPGGSVALSITLSLDHTAGSSLLLLEAGLLPQYGLVLSSGSGGLGLSSAGAKKQGFGGPSSGEVLPIRVLPGGSAGLCFMLMQDQGDKLTGSFEADGNSLLQLSYCLETTGQPADIIVDPESGQQLPAPPASIAAAAGVDSVTSLATPAAAAPEAVPGSSSSSVMSLRLPFWLEFPSHTPAATASLRATLLGPFTGRVGHAMTLSWQLARMGAGIVGGDLAGLTTIDLGSGAAAAAAQDGGVDSSGSQGSAAAASQQQQQQHAGDSSSSSGRDCDEVLCYELVPGEPSEAAAAAGAALQAADPLHNSLQGPGALAALLLQQQQQDLNPRPEARAWWAGGSTGGMVRLGRAAGSLAAVEVVVLPRVAGRVLPPRLVLRSLGGSQPLLVESGMARGLWVDEEELCMHISA